MSHEFDDVSDERRRTMQAIGSEGTGPEEAMEAALREIGVRYDKQPSIGRYRPDFLLEDGTVLQAMGCFWHCCPCQRGMDEVKSNEDYWTEKHEKNHERDHRRRRELLEEQGAPCVFWIWEHEDVAQRVLDLCEARGLA